MDFHKYSTGRIRFINTYGISYKQFQEMKQLLENSFPDEDTLKEYLDSGAVLTPDQSKKILSVLYQSHFRSESNIFAEDIRKDAISYFGETKEWNKAGYILPDGTMLDFSGGENSKRIEDHREIDTIVSEYNILPSEHTPTDAVILFMNDGNIRISEYGIETSTPLTAAQKSKIQRAEVLRNRENIFVDISNLSGVVVKSLEYTRPYSFTKIFTDIENFFNNLIY